MLNNWVNFRFSIMKKLWDWAHENLVNIQGSHGILDQYPRRTWPSITKSVQKLLATVSGLLSFKSFEVSYFDSQCVLQFFFAGKRSDISKAIYGVLNFCKKRTKIFYQLVIVLFLESWGDYNFLSKFSELWFS